MKTIVLETEQGEEVAFDEIATISSEDKTYLIMKPTVCPDGMDEDEAVVFELQEEDGEERYIVVVDDEIIDGVFEEYYRFADVE